MKNLQSLANNEEDGQDSESDSGNDLSLFKDLGKDDTRIEKATFIDSCLVDLIAQSEVQSFFSSNIRAPKSCQTVLF